MCFKLKDFDCRYYYTDKFNLKQDRVLYFVLCHRGILEQQPISNSRLSLFM